MGSSLQIAACLSCAGLQIDEMIAQSVTTMKRRVDSAILRNRQRVGKYRIERRLAQGGFAYVYQAMDTIEGIRSH